MSGDPVSTLAYALHHACCVALPEFDHVTHTWVDETAASLNARKVRDQDNITKRRPEFYEVNVTMFQQGWSNTACGHGGIAGQAFTSAYTVVVECKHSQACAVYFGPRLAYVVKHPNTEFWEDVGHFQLRGKGEGLGRYSRLADYSGAAVSPPLPAQLTQSEAVHHQMVGRKKRSKS